MRSKAEELAALPEAERLKVLAELEAAKPGAAAALLSAWEGFWARPEQVRPACPVCERNAAEILDEGPLDCCDAWDVWAMITGRGFGKTRSGSGWVHKRVDAGARRIALVHRTVGDCREITVEGEDGLLATAPPGRMPRYEPSKRRVTFHTGAMATTFSAEEPDQLRGPTHDTVLCEEFATWKHTTGIDGLTAFDNAVFSLRAQQKLRPQALVVTTPKRVPSVRDIESKVLTKPVEYRITRGSMMDNRTNLAQSYIDHVFSRYAGTALGEQEIDGILARTVEGAIFTEKMFDASRIVDVRELPELATPVVAVDPSVGDGSGDECGICVTALSAAPLPTELQHAGLSVWRDVRHGYVLDDATIAADPDGWAQRVAATAAEWKTTTVVAEKNQGGLMVKSVLRSADPNLRVRLVSASKGKEARAQPTAALFTQRRWHLVGHFAELEDQCTTWVPGSGDSPDRLDAMVWAQAALEPASEAAPPARVTSEGMTRSIFG